MLFALGSAPTIGCGWCRAFAIRRRAPCRLQCADVPTARGNGVMLPHKSEPIEWMSPIDPIGVEVCRPQPKKHFRLTDIEPPAL